MAAATVTTDEEEIRRLDAEWSNAASGGIENLDRVVAFYAPNGSAVWPGAPAFQGTRNIRRAWKQSFTEMENLKLKFGPVKIEIAPGGQMASDFGKVSLQYTQKKRVKGKVVQETVRQRAKYVVVWTKIDGAWKVLYDCWNLNEA